MTRASDLSDRGSPTLIQPHYKEGISGDQPGITKQVHHRLMNIKENA